MAMIRFSLFTINDIIVIINFALSMIKPATETI